MPILFVDCGLIGLVVETVVVDNTAKLDDTKNNSDIKINNAKRLDH